MKKMLLMVTFLLGVYTNASAECKMVLIDKQSWSRSGFGNVAIHNLTIKNYGDKDVKDLNIKCVYDGRSGTTIGSNTKVIYDVVKAKKIKKFNKINMGFINSQAAGSECEILSCKYVE